MDHDHRPRRPLERRARQDLANYIGGAFFANGGSLTIPSNATLTVNGERFLANNGIAVLLSGILNVRDWGTIGAAEGFPEAPESTMILKDSGQLNMPTSFFIVGDGGLNDGRLTIQDSAELNASMLILGQYGQGTRGYVFQNSGTVNLTLANAASLWYIIPALQIGSSASINWGDTWGNGQGEYHLEGGTLTAHSIGGSATAKQTDFPKMDRGRVLLPERFTWFRQIQICTFGVPRVAGSLPCCPLNCGLIVRSRRMRVKRMKIRF